MSKTIVHQFKDENDLSDKTGLPKVKYFTKEKGEGDQVTSVMSIGDGENRTSFAKIDLTDTEVAEIKSGNFGRVICKRTTKAILAIRSMCNTANKAMYNWTEDEAVKIMETLQTEMAILESKLYQVPTEKDEKKAYSFSL